MADESPLPQERRSYPRVRALYLVHYVTDSEAFERTSAKIGRTLDISSAGVRLEIYEAIAPGTDVEVEIALGDLVFSTRGKTVHTLETDSGIFIAGIEFEQLHPELVPMIDGTTSR